MKKMFLFAVAAMIGITASAADLTKAEYIARRKAAAEKKGMEFDQKTLEAFFDKKDVNKDGILSSDEAAPAKPKKAE
jgi:hypothetical protein